MGYRPEEQSIEDPLTKISEGMREFEGAIDVRIECAEWKDEHIEELLELSAEFRKLKAHMVRLIRDNW